MEFAEKYFELSGLESHELDLARKKYLSFLNNLSTNGDVKKAASTVKSALFDGGFKYQMDSFRAHDTLLRGKGNCLGMPILIGSTLMDLGYKPEFNLVIRPQDATAQCEENLFNHLNENMSYSNPPLATENINSEFYTFHPLRHLVLNLDDFLFETTSKEDEFTSSYEEIIPITYENALACLCADSFAEGTRQDKLNTSDLEKAIELWPDGLIVRNLALVYSGLANDEEAYNNHLNHIIKNNENNSIWNNIVFNATGDVEYLEKALDCYPYYAEAICSKAELDIETDPRESKFNYCLASQLYANSKLLNLADFYVKNVKGLIHLFEGKKIETALEQFYDEREDSFAFNWALYLASGNKVDLENAQRTAITPSDKKAIENYCIK